MGCFVVNQIARAPEYSFSLTGETSGYSVQRRRVLSAANAGGFMHGPAPSLLRFGVALVISVAAVCAGGWGIGLLEGTPLCCMSIRVVVGGLIKCSILHLNIGGDLPGFPWDLS